MDLTRLYEFVIISREQSIKKAAEALQLAPTTLKSRLKTLEDSLGVILFEQKSGKLHLSPKGSLFISTQKILCLNILVLQTLFTLLKSIFFIT